MKNGLQRTGEVRSDFRRRIGGPQRGCKRAPAWSREELAILREHYPNGGLNSVTDLLPERSWQAIQVMASKLGIRSDVITDAPRPKLAGEDLEEAIRLREGESWSFARIGARFGVCEASACNAVLIALCTRKGYRPAERDKHGRLTDEAKDRLRLMLRKGLKGCEIQLRLGVSAACVAEQRRRYARDLKERGKAALPPPGGGLRYSGARIAKEATRQIEALYLEGFGTAKISQRTGVSKTHCLRTRTKLIRRLKRKGETLPGCDQDGRRRVQKESSRFVPVEALAALRFRLLQGWPVRRAALELGIGLSNAYRERDALKSELAQRGETLPASSWRSEQRKGVERPLAITGSKNIYRLRELARSMPYEDARAALLAELEAERRAEAEAIGSAIASFAAACRELYLAERRRPKTLEEQIAALERGATLTAAFRPFRATPDVTLGGVATAAIA